MKSKNLFLFSLLFLFFFAFSISISGEEKIFSKDLKDTSENISGLSESEILKKIYSRPYPNRSSYSYEPRQFALQGLETPFLDTSYDARMVENIYQLLAKAGVERIRTGASYWHRLSETYDQYKELDFHVTNARKYGIDFMFVVGYPPAKYNVESSVTSSFKPEYKNLYRQYIRTLLRRYKGIVKDVEVGNEVDVPNVWWKGGTPEMYVRDCRIVKEESLIVDPKIKVIGFAATGSRNSSNGDSLSSRKFVDSVFNLGIDKYVDSYSLHYTWPLAEKNLTKYFKGKLDEFSIKKELISSEDTGYYRPSDVIKVFARDLFLYNLNRVTYFLARDYVENGKLMHAGLFDVNWKPKPRLLAYAFSVDSMKNRKLVGLAQPSPGIEAYILSPASHTSHLRPKYSIIMWKNHSNNSREILDPVKQPRKLENVPTKVFGIQNVVSSYSWKLDKINILKKDIFFSIGEDPVVVFTENLPSWRIYSAEEWIKNIKD
jgi:hypothetical protein